MRTNSALFQTLSALFLLISTPAFSEDPTATAKCRLKDWSGVEQTAATVVRTVDGDTAHVKV
ncbi:MAG TPA: hypothetical protein VL588_04450, partial [Bdellovibrionota bacterium]|nr:hypothetical protein [Bdellovibrionota bacterium]